MTFKTAIREYGLLGIWRRIICIVIGHDYYIGRACIYCDQLKEDRK